MFEPKPTHPKWYLKLYPYLWMLTYSPKSLLKGNWGWHYEWEHSENEQEDLYISQTIGKRHSKIRTDRDIH